MILCKMFISLTCIRKEVQERGLVSYHLQFSIYRPSTTLSDDYTYQRRLWLLRVYTGRRDNDN